MENMKEVGLEALEQATGGVKRVVNTGTDDKAAIRSDPWKGKRNQIDALVNGTIVDTITDQLVYDETSGRNYVKIKYSNSKGQTSYGWIAASIVGLPR